MAGLPWTDTEEQDLGDALDEDGQGKWTQGAYAIFIASNPAVNCRRSFDGCRRKLRTLSAERLAGEQAEVVGGPIWEGQRAIIIRENQRLRQENEHLRATNELMIEAMEESVARLPTFKPPRPHVIKKSKRRPQVVMLDISDVHGGEVVRPEDVAGLGRYDFDLCKERMDTLRESLLSICDVYQMSGISIPKLVVNFLGDIVTNEDIYIGQGRDIDRILVDQIVQLASELTRKVLYPFCQYFPEVVANAVWGNHGRMGRKGTYHKRTNADYLLYHFIRQTMGHVENFTMRISLSSFMGYVLLEDPKRPHLLAHGDQIRRYLNIPWYGMERFEARMVGLTQVPWAFTHLGHHHQAASIDGPHGERLVNGSWVGGSDYSIDRLQAGGQAKQTFIGLHEEWGKTFQYSIYLQKERPKLTLGKDGLYTPVWGEDKETKLR